MGREHDLLEAARSGNLHLVERILEHRAKLSGPLASLRRGPGANVQDSSGYAPLHHAALNGHKDIVQLLMSYDAQPNILDTKGSSPLHLAAWAGHVGIVKLLLSNRQTNVNLTTRDNESALHCAAQYGHTAVVSMLLQHGADPTVRSVRDETALDLASQYGRLETVELLVRTHPELLEPYRNSRGMFSHTPLHRASKNGHKAVVVVLLKAGHNVNACTAAGTALHEAALCGKVSVVRALLTRGADPRIRDRIGDTVLDALARFPPHVTHEIVTLINQYRLSNGFDSDLEELPKIPLHQHDGLNSPYDNMYHPMNANRHIWERREEDERRVSGTSAISMNPQTNPVPSLKQITNKPHPSNYMLQLASKCFGISLKTKSIASTSTLNYRRKPVDSKTAKDTQTSAKSASKAVTLKVGRSKFFRRKSGDKKTAEEAYEVKKSLKMKRRNTPLLSSSLPDILEGSERSSERSDSYKSVVSVTNSLYTPSELCEHFSPTPLVENTKDVEKIKTVDSYDEKASKSPDITQIKEISTSKIDPEILSSSPNESNAKYEIAKPALRLSHSIRTLKNWTPDNANFKNTEPDYSEENYQDKLEANMLYASLEFNNPMSPKKLQDVIESDYEPFDFKNEECSKSPEDDLCDPNTFRPIKVYRGSSTVFIDTDALEQDVKNGNKRQERRRSSTSSTIEKLSEKCGNKPTPPNRPSLCNKVTQTQPIPAPRRKFSESDAMYTNTTNSRRTSCSDIYTRDSIGDAGSRSNSWKLVTGSAFPSVPEMLYGNTQRRYSTPNALASRRSSNTSTAADSSFRSTESNYLPMDGILRFSKQLNRSYHFDDYRISVSTLRQIRDKDDPIYQNVVPAKDIKERMVESSLVANESPFSPTYHLRGTGNCIYDSYSQKDFIYVFNRESVLDTNVNPFIKLPVRPISREDDPRNICFCKNKPENIYANAKILPSAIRRRSLIVDSLEQRSFTCYCQNSSCKLHHTKTSRDPLVVHYSPLTHSISFPDFRLLNIDDTSPNISFIDHTNASAFAPYLPKLSSRSSSSSSVSFHSVLSEPQYAVVGAGPRRQSTSSIYEYVDPRQFTNNISLDKSSIGVPNVAEDAGVSGVGFDTAVEPLLCHTLEGGRLSLCVRSGSDGGHYPYSKSSAVMDGSYHSEELSSSYQSGKTREPDQCSVSSTSSAGGPSPRERQRCGTNESTISGQGYMAHPSAGYHAHSPGSNTKVSPTPPKKPPRRNLSVSPTHLLPPGGIPDGITSADRSHLLIRTGQTRSQDDLDDLGPNIKHSGLKHGRSVDQYVDTKVSPRTKPVPQPRPSLAVLQARRDQQPVAINAMYENVVIKEQNPRRKLRRNNPNQYENFQPKELNNDDAQDDSGYVRPRNQRYQSSQEKSSLESLLDDVSSYQGGSTVSDAESMGGYRNDRSTQQTPLSPTHYNQPPTPDHPPPSAKQAEMSIHERIRPLSQEYKRMSRDMETETDPRLLARSSSPASSASTDHCVEEYVTEIPFAGLFKGSTTTLDGIGVRPVPAERPKSLRKLKAVYDNGPDGTGIIIRPKEVQPGIRIDPDVDPWQYRNIDINKEQVNSNPPSTTTSVDKPLSLLSPFDEQEEWAKINEIMASYGSGLVRESVFAEELEQEFKSRLGARFSSESSLSPCVPTAPSILSWLGSLGLQHLESNFINNGYDDLDFINGVIEDNDLAEMAIEEPEKTKVLESCKSLPSKIDDVMSVGPNNHNNNSKNNNVNDDDPEAVNKWLTSIGLECYQDTFRRHLYTDMERVRRIWEVELTAVLEIQKVGHRRRILASVAGRQNGPINNIEDIKADLNTLERNIQTLKAEIKEKLPDTPKINHMSNNVQEPMIPQAKPAPVPHATPALQTNQNLSTGTPGGETLKRSHKKNRPPPPPPARPDLEIRAPSALLVGVPGSLCTQWKHQPLVLVTGSVMYVANYLGSTIVKELRGKESTQKSIQKLKKSNNEPRALPDIILSISYRGVKFLNTITRDLICEHEIRNIHLACQDADDLTHFAYITKDVTKTHYCHVFCVATMDQATEVILTLGQAFEVAYQMALREQSMRNVNNNTQVQPSQVRSSQSSNQISQQAKTPTHDKASNNSIKDKPNPVHGRSHSVTEIKLNGHQLKIAPITVSLSNEDFQVSSRNGDVQKSPRTPSAKAPIALAEEL